MITIYQIFGFILAFTVSLVSTPFVIKFAKRFGFVDIPNYRKVHKDPKPLIGGLSIVLGATAGILYLKPFYNYLVPVMLGGFIILVIGLIDDKYNLTPKWKMLGQLIAALIVVFSGVKINFIIIPFTGERIELGIFSYIIAIIWIIAITNAINLIDGLDGLSAGISAIALSSILVLSIMNGQMFVISITVILIGSILGFLPYNFHPAKIFLGDTGALFLGYCIAVISILGLYKSVTIFSLGLPIIALAVPIFDTMFAILRRILNKQKISTADKAHLHHRLLAMGYSHRATVMIIYAIGASFGLSAILFTRGTLWFSLLIIVALCILFQVLAELIGLIGNHKPLLTVLSKLTNSRTPLKDKNN
ncbi:glycosyltransferase family 4 protein [Metabacillus sediminilitoris]|uniref:Undecaprenyl/decaprenyl-phosphate alpha-N-acetylglucosaminyl 1-phosphate transferase n=1 Tax=Metabacillus sediminilitoris TaxID=2567941 RepID=A0A4S4C1G0_9BACI|nr:MraY family glycosyltransferase [Metabacillus sediminilitoris]QGQ48157.1 undecaprenyl-phosphate alpha-N-acetylglucosaminyl 1-phosphate transferase [Metabacillus sediminilitoris]THF81480.1 undecaprenyl/decaprenyl-phosphate alpha-N-acetylglucosaminyl 1-phosphate transferase [Metabacillus sediminilitoris]